MSDVIYSVIIPAWNEAELLPRTLNALYEGMKSQSVTGEVIVVDNNSTDSTSTIAESFGARVVFEKINNIGLARNSGAKAARGNIIIFTDADTLVNADLLHETLKRMTSGRFYAGGANIAFDDSISWFAHFMTRFWNRTALTRKSAAGSYLYALKSEFDAIGGFSSELYAAEEIYLCRALARRNRKSCLKFSHITEFSITTSARKMQNHNSWKMFTQMFLLGLFPNLLRSKKACSLWYKR